MSPMPEPVLALLDDSRASGAGSRLYTGFVHEHRCEDPAGLEACWAAVSADQQRGLHAVLLADYEWGARLLGAGLGGLVPGLRPALRLLMFRQLEHLDRPAVDRWLAQAEGQPDPGPAGAMGLQDSVDEAAFVAAIDTVQEAIRNGETYQINYTYRMQGEAHGHPLALFRRLRARQPVAYGAYVVLPPVADEPDAPDALRAPRHVLSLSPELFLQHRGGRLTAKPMKGTAARLSVPESDSEAARLLQQDIKNRAENLMIVDLLRNDLGRVAQVGSVRVPALFSVEPYATVFQMTSTVQADLRPGTGMPELLRALYPCGSITGAPKHHTMDLIAGLEHTPRGLYCGAIGWVDAPLPGARYSSLGDFCLSVAIRTLTLGAPCPGRGTRPLRLGVGAGIVQDSVATEEYQECRLKARFLTGLDPGFGLFETMRVAPAESAGALPQLCRLDAHLARLSRSAAVLGFACPWPDLQAALDQALLQIARAEPAPLGWRLRLDLRHDGGHHVQWAALEPLATDAQGRVSFRLASERLPNAQALSAHKTSLRGPNEAAGRGLYDRAVHAAQAEGDFDQLFLTADGRLVEGGRSSLLLRQGEAWLTPALADGALAGVMRAELLASGWQGLPVREASLRLADLDRADGLALANALRGVLPAMWRQA